MSTRTALSLLITSALIALASADLAGMTQTRSRQAALRDAPAPTVIKVAEPQKLTISGGESATVRFRGQHLGELDKAEVRANGVPLTGVSVTYLRSRDPSVRDIRIETEKSVEHATLAELVLTTRSGAVVRTPLMLSIDSEILVTGTRPRAIKLMIGGPPIRVVVTGRNLHLVDNAGFYELTNDPAAYQKAVVTLLPGSEQTSRTLEIRAPARHEPNQVSWTLGVQGPRSLYEVAPVTVLPTRSDLVIADMMMGRDPPACSGCRRKPFWDVTVRNQGNWTSPFSLPVCSLLWRGTTRAAAFEAEPGSTAAGWQISELDPGEETTLRLRANGEEGTNTIRCLIAPIDDVTDNNETSNTFSITNQIAVRSRIEAPLGITRYEGEDHE